MAETFGIDKLFWGLTFFLNAGLVILVLYRKNVRVFPFFFLYALLDLAHGVVIFESYRIWGFNSATSRNIAWGTQGLVTFARALAVAEGCYRILAKFRGIWELAWRTLVTAGVFVSFYAWAVSRGSWQFAILNLDRSLELVIASVIVLLFLFARYYEVAVQPTVRTLVTGFFLYSCFRIVNDSILERWLHTYATLWNFFGTVTFLASLLLWIWALRLTQQQTAAEPELLPEDHYRSLSPAINARLRGLNEQLSHFWYAEGKKT
ncbi:MAG: hypothetical protein DMG37_11635 [Acidobacteria bacterium]|nr:MAG: hypothetical protein DMG37_11635 [Acidobacteriota bacterium]